MGPRTGEREEIGRIEEGMAKTAVSTKAGVDMYLGAFEQFDKNVNGKSFEKLRQIRRSAIGKFSGLGFPTTSDEKWKYTNVSAIAETKFQLVSEAADQALSVKDLAPYLFGREDWPRVVLVNGIYSERLSSLNGLPSEVKVKSLASALAEDFGSVQNWLRKTSETSNAFSVLNTAFLQDGVFVEISKGAELKLPLQILYVSTAVGRGPWMTHPRNIFHLAQTSRATVLESFASLGERPYFVNIATDVVLDEGAALDFYQILKEGKESFHIETIEANLARSSVLNAHSLALDGKLVRNDLHVGLNGEGASAELNGLYLVSEGRHVDNTILIDHAKPGGTSRQLYKGILQGKSKAAFNGKIYVHKDAQKTDANQINKSLVLSDGAVADTRPQLEIYADDVKCSHGGAVGQIDEESLFYLKSRGIGEEKARRLLCYGFASEVTGRLKLEELRREMDRHLEAWI